MFKLTGTMTAPDGTVYPVTYNELLSGCAQRLLYRIKAYGWTAELECTVSSGAGSVTYKITL